MLLSDILRKAIALISCIILNQTCSVPYNRRLQVLEASAYNYMYIFFNHQMPKGDFYCISSLTAPEVQLKFMIVIASNIMI